MSYHDIGTDLQSVVWFSASTPVYSCNYAVGINKLDKRFKNIFAYDIHVTRHLLTLLVFLRTYVCIGLVTFPSVSLHLCTFIS